MATVFAMLQKTIIGLGAVAAHPERPRGETVHISVVIDELIVEHARTESADADAHPRASPESAEPPEPQRKIHR